MRFNPHPTRTPGATAANYSAGEQLCNVSTLTRRERRVRLARNLVRYIENMVSTLTRRERRVRHVVPSFLGRFVACFNPHPTRTPGATPEKPFGAAGFAVFQPSPDANAGCDHIGGCQQQPPMSFNPHPTRTPGATV